MKLLDGLLDVYYLNGLAAVGLVFITFSFHKLFTPIDKRTDSFFLFLSIAWSVNVVYISFLEISSRRTLESDLLRHTLIQVINTISYCFFLLASRWKLAERLPVLYSLPFMISAPLIALSSIALSLVFPDRASVFAIPYTLLGIVAIMAVGINYHIYFNTTHHQFGGTTKKSLVYSMYLYAMLQVGVFLVPPFSRVVVSRFPHIEEIFFLLGACLKLVHTAGLSFLGATIFAAYQSRLTLIDRARLSVSLADQLAHELQTPAAELRVRIGPLIETRSEDSTAKSELKVIAGLLEQITGLIGVFERFQRDQRLDRPSEPVLISCNLNNICDAAIVSFKLTLRPNCRIEKDYDIGPVVYGLESELTQIVRNLLKNAIESVLEEVALEAKKRIGVVRVKTVTLKEERLVRLTIEDNGLGIDSGVVARIFEDGVSTKSGFGRGHGLFIAKTLAERHGGTIQAQNMQRDSAVLGARFTVELPLAVVDRGIRKGHNGNITG